MDSIKQFLPAVLGEIKSPEKKLRSRLIEVWPKVAGPKIAAHTKPQLSEKGELRVWVDEPVLAYELGQKHKAALLRRAQAVLGKEAVKSVRFYVGQIR